MAKEIQATLVLEILGRPADYIKKALTELVDRLSSEKGVKIIDKVIHEPVPVKDTKDIFTTFAEVTVEFESLVNYFGVIFSYMPAHIEIISPASFTITNSHLNELGNKLLARLHDYDAITKKVMSERNFALTKLKELAPELFQKAPQAAEPAVQQEEPKEKTSKKKSKKK